LVDSLPDVPFAVGELYSGVVALNYTNSTGRGLFFMFKPTIGEPVDEVTIWLNVCYLFVLLSTGLTQP